jgi:anti-anti-sigma regulatory factor
MTTNHDTLRIDVRKDVGSLLMLRSTVTPLFRRISRSNARRVVVDFSGVEFMSRSFADEYLAAKAASLKQIEERRVPVEVKRMMSIVSRQLASGSKPTPQAGQPFPRAEMLSL